MKYIYQWLKAFYTAMNNELDSKTTSSLVYPARPFSRYARSGWGKSTARKESSTGHCWSKLITDDHTQYAWQKYIWPERLTYVMVMAMASARSNSDQCNICQCCNFRELLAVKSHELLITDQLWVVESVKIQLKVTCARPFSRRALASPISSIARKGSSLINYFFSLVAPVHLMAPVCFVL